MYTYIYVYIRIYIYIWYDLYVHRKREENLKKKQNQKRRLINSNRTYDRVVEWNQKIDRYGGSQNVYTACDQS